MVGAYLIVGIVWAWLVLELNVWSGHAEEFQEFSLFAGIFALGWITLIWPLSMLRVLRNLLR